jgi:GTP-binding protein
VRNELVQYDPKLGERPEIVALSQADRPEVRDAYPELAAEFKARFGVELLLVSAASRFQLDELLQTIAKRLPPRVAPPPAAEPKDSEPEDSAPEAAPPAAPPGDGTP